MSLYCKASIDSYHLSALQNNKFLFYSLVVCRNIRSCTFISYKYFSVRLFPPVRLFILIQYITHFFNSKKSTIFFVLFLILVEFYMAIFALDVYSSSNFPHVRLFWPVRSLVCTYCTFIRDLRVPG